MAEPWKPPAGLVETCHVLTEIVRVCVDGDRVDDALRAANLLLTVLDTEEQVRDLHEQVLRDACVDRTCKEEALARGTNPPAVGWVTGGMTPGG